MGGISKSSKKILVVDDNETIVISITKVLEKEGYKTDFAYNGKTAIDKALSTNFGLILLDITLPDIDGFMVCRELKKYSVTRHIPIIFISTLDDDTIYEKGFDLGVMDYLKKPLPSAELVFRIKNYLKLADTENKLRQSELLFRSIVNDQTEFVVRYKPDGTLTFVNTAFSLYLKRSIMELLGMNFFDVLNIEKDAEIRTRVMTTSMPVQTDTLSIVLPGGEKAWNHWTHRTILDRATHKVVVQAIGRDITKNKIAEDNLRRWEYIFTNAGFGIIVTSADSINLDQMNREYARMHGYTVEELEGKKISTVFSNGSDEFVKEILDNVKREGHYSFQSMHRKKNGEDFPAFTDLSLMKDDKGNTLMILATVQDISESVAADNALKESEERFRTIFMNTPDIMAIFRLSDMAMVDANDKFFETSGFTKKEALNKPRIVARFFETPSDLNMIVDLIKGKEVLSNLELNLVTKEGHHYPALLSCSKIYLKGQSHVVAIIRNIENIKKYQESLLASETKFRLLADYNYNWEFWLGPDKDYIYISPSCERISGFAVTDFMRTPDLMLDIIHPLYRDKYREHLKDKNWKSNRTESLELIIIDRHGNEKWISHNCNPVYDHSGNFLGRRGSNRDITQNKTSEKELLKLSTALKQSRSAIVIVDTKGVIEYINPFFEELTGYSSQEVMGRGITDLITDRAEVDFLREVNKSIAAEDIWQGEILNRRKNSESFALNVIITPIRDDENKIVNYIGIGQDITRQKEIDRQILQTIISTEEKERSRFAQDLHDELGPLLSTAKLYIRSFETAKDDKNREIAITRSMMAIDEAIMSIKQIANNISPHVLRNFGLTSGIQSFINKINEANTLRINFRTEVEERFDENMESSLFRIVAELVNNTIKHANASHAEISLRRTAKMLVLNYSDDGVGFRLEDALDKKLARGITNIINRSKSLGGDIAFGNSPKTGFSVSIKIPVATHIITPRQN